MMEMFSHARVVIILQYIDLSSQPVVYLEFTQCCMSLLSQ